MIQSAVFSSIAHEVESLCDARVGHRHTLERLLPLHPTRKIDGHGGIFGAKLACLQLEFPIKPRPG